jgi:PAS domain S-box-containing protein
MPPPDSRVRFSLRTKLTATFLAVGLVLVLSNVLSTRWLQGRWENVSAERAKTIHLAEDLDDIANSAFEEGFAYVLTADLGEKAHCLAKLEQFGVWRRRILERVAPGSAAAASLARVNEPLNGAMSSAEAMFDEYDVRHHVRAVTVERYEAAMDELSGKGSQLADIVRKEAGTDDLAARKLLNEMLLGIGLAAAVFTITLGTVFGHRLTRPLLRLRDATRRFGRGELNVEFHERSNDEFAQVAAAFGDMATNIGTLLAAVEQQKRRLEDVFGSLGEMLLVCGSDGKITSANRSACTTLGYDEAELVGRDLHTLFDSVCFDDLRRRASRADGVEPDATSETDLRVVRHDGKRLLASVSTSELRTDAQNSAGLVCVVRDLSEHRRLEAELRQAQKLEAIGRLASGIAHEINTPVQFVSDSVHFARDAAGDMAALLQQYRAAERATGETARAELLAEARAAEGHSNLPYILERLPAALDRSLEGLARIATIVRSMKVFAYPGQEQMSAVDLNQAVLATLTVASTEYKYVADLETQLSELPPVRCHIGEINQAVLNLVVNAAHAIADRNPDGTKGLIRVQTRVQGKSVIISISDNGGGIPDAIRDQIFDPFFTTKEVGRGTGQGLGVARVAVVDKHRGKLTFETELGVGTTFHIRLPIDGTTTSLVPTSALTVAA